MSIPSISLIEYLSVGSPGLLAGGVVMISLSFATKFLAAPLVSKVDDQWHNAAFSPRLWDNFLILAAVSYFTALDNANPSTKHSGDTPTSLVAAMAMVSIFWHFFFRNAYAYQLEPLASGFRNWKIGLLQTLITFLACTVCLAVIGYGIIRFG